MNYIVNISDQADKDIRSIFEYIAVSLMSPENAVAQLSRLEERIGKLEQLPKRFPIYKNDIHMMPVDNYLVFYSVYDISNTVAVLRVMYGRRDIDKKL
ncbi:MAG: type II toxin-antitoxin system RelE/ParE family toxin [Ruminococcus sp.]|nr:type II toxin-antitoxin system RelE/ParE family toxin [Ruminococcus sp.]